MGRSLRASPEYGWLLPVLGSPDPRFPPYVVRPLHVHGAPAYGRYLPGGPDVAVGVPKQGPDGIRGGGWHPKPSLCRTVLGSLGRPWAACVARVVEDAVRETHRNRATTLAKRYAQCGLADKCAQKHTNR